MLHTTLKSSDHSTSSQLEIKLYTSVMKSLLNSTSPLVQKK